MKTQIAPACSALSVANRILIHSFSQGRLINAIRLQKLLYFCQGYSLAMKDSECFTDEIKAEEYGPIVISVKEAFRHYGADNIDSVAVIDRDYSDTQMVAPMSDDNPNAEIVDAVCKSYLNYETFQLSEICRRGSPYAEVKANKRKDRDGNYGVVSRTAMMEHFKALIDRTG